MILAFHYQFTQVQHWFNTIIIFPFEETPTHFLYFKMAAGEAKSLKKNILPFKNNDNKCDVCDKSFSSPKILISHFLKIHLAIKAKSLKKNIAKFRCDFCDKLFPTKTAILIHNKTHEIKKDLASNKDEKKEKFLCALCQKKFVYEITLNAHIKLNHQSPLIKEKKKKTKVENTNQDIHLTEKENNSAIEKIDEELPVSVVDKNVERANYYKMKILSSQAEVAREKTKLIQQRIKIDRILEFYQTQEAMAKAKNL